MGKQVICYIQAFDCERTIEAAMQSVLDQTYGDWLCFVLSNGNQNTVNAPNWSFDIIKSFAMKDKRFVVLNKEKNSMEMYIPMLYHLARNFSGSYICSLDADDVYQKDFFSRAVALAEEEQLDIVACGTEIVQKKNAETTEEVFLSRRALGENLVIRGGDFTQRFVTYKPFFNEMWGKLYRADLFDHQHNESYANKHFYGQFLPDTLFTVDNLSRSTAIGVLSGTSHKFYQFEQRNVTNATVISNAYEANRWSVRKALSGKKFSVYTTYETVMDFLRSRGEVDDALYEYMQAVLFGWFGDFYTRTLLLTLDEAKLAGHAERLVFHPKFDELMSYPGSGKYNNLRNFEDRIAFCKNLSHMLVGQKVIKNRAKKFTCTVRTRKKIDKVMTKLNRTIQAMS